MDSFELNKIIGAILGTLLFVMGVGFLAESIYHPTAAGAGYNLPEPEGGGERIRSAPFLEGNNFKIGSATVAAGDAKPGGVVQR